MRRGRKSPAKSHVHSNTFKLLHSNIRGVRSKIHSLNCVNNIVTPDPVTLNEHGVSSKNKVMIENYKTFSKNRQASKMGGVSISVPSKDISEYIKTKEGEGNDEYIIVRNSSYNPPLNIVTFYSPVESRTSKDDIDERWKRFLSDLAKIELRNEDVIIAGDLNCKVGNDDLGVSGNFPEISQGGTYVRSLFFSGKYILANNLSKCRGGPFTRFDPANPDNKTVLDLVSGSEIIIDSESKYPMQYTKVVKKKTSSENGSFHYHCYT